MGVRLCPTVRFLKHPRVGLRLCPFCYMKNLNTRIRPLVFSFVHEEVHEKKEVHHVGRCLSMGRNFQKDDSILKKAGLVKFGLNFCVDKMESKPDFKGSL